MVCLCETMIQKNRGPAARPAAIACSVPGGGWPRLLWALFYLAIGLGAGALFIRELLADKSGWDYMDYIVLAVSGGLCLGGLAAASL